MSHSGIDPEMQKALRAGMKHLLGEYPEGKLNHTDEGAINMGIGHQDGKVIVQFPKAVSWIGVTPEQAIDIAESLVEQARACGCTRPLTLKIG